MAKHHDRTPKHPSAQERDERICRQRHREQIDRLRSTLAKNQEENAESDGEQDIDQLRDEPLSIECRRSLKITLSWGGPSDGFNIELDGDGDAIGGEYWYADWFTYASERLPREEVELVVDAYLGGDPSAYVS